MNHFGHKEKNNVTWLSDSFFYLFRLFKNVSGNLWAVGFISWRRWALGLTVIGFYMTASIIIPFYFLFFIIFKSAIGVTESRRQRWSCFGLFIKEKSTNLTNLITIFKSQKGMRSSFFYPKSIQFLKHFDDYFQKINK